MWLILAGVRYGPYPHTFAEGLRHCYTIKGNFADAIIVPTDEPRSPHWVVSAGRRYIQHGSSMITGTPPEEKE